MAETVVDLMLKHLGNLVEAIQRSNERFIRNDRELGEIHTKINALSNKIEALADRMDAGFRDVRSDLLLMENRLLSAEHKSARSELLPRAGDDDAA